ncbi:MAG: isoprenyl transferase [Candidatus Margulisiibacteriota bacterium]
MDYQNIPQHIAIIMDGNGRWASQRGLPRVAGHREGAESLREVLKTCAQLGVKYLTVYAFSTENWQRPQEEVDFLMNLLSQTIDREINELIKEEVRVQFLGRLEKLPGSLQQKMKEAMAKTKENDRITLNVMVNYGSRAEIADAVKKMVRDQLKEEEISEQRISDYLYTKGIPDPDLLIRTANEMRISNFLLWQIAYTELYVTPTLWPDFRREQLLEAIANYQGRIRKFGKTEEQL